MSDKIKDTEKVDVNNRLQAINEDNLEEVAGGRRLVLEFIDRVAISGEWEDVISLINKHDSLMRKSNALNVIACENPKSFNEDATIRATDVKIRKELVEVKDKLRNYYKKFSNIPELKRFR